LHRSSGRNQRFFVTALNVIFMLFSELNLLEPILNALHNQGYTNPTPIQEQAIPVVLSGRDVMGCAQTGTGKTAAFAIPILQNLMATRNPNQKRKIRSLIVTPTRELAIQIHESFQNYGKGLPLKSMVIFGGVGQNPQTNQLNAGTDILIATPGRLLDLQQQGFIQLNQLEIFVLDEADRMLDMGFIHDVRKILKLIPSKRQSLFFSATMPKEIVELSNTILTKPVHIQVTPVSSTAETIQQELYYVATAYKKDLLLEILEKQNVKTALVFTRTKHGADKLSRALNSAGIKTEAIHGNKSQNARQNALNNFKSHTTRVLVATDIAARGIDIDLLSFVVNFDVPNIPETYVHRIGRTGRAGNQGKSVSFSNAEERAYIKDIQKLIGLQIPVVNHSFPQPDENEPTTAQVRESNRMKQNFRKPVKKSVARKTI